MGRFLQISTDIAVLNHRLHRSVLDQRGSVAYNAERLMSLSLYRYYYYYGPLSTGRDGQAMGCRRALMM